MRRPALNIIIKAARRAGHIILRNINRIDGLKVESKSLHDYVSEVDRQAEAEIIKELRKAYPQYGVLGEESGASGSQEDCWIIDPLDGTSNYLRGLPHFCISIALMEKGVIEAGVIYDPLREELFTASRGSGAFVNDRRIRVSGRAQFEGSLLCTGFPFRMRPYLEPHLAMLRAVLTDCEDIRRSGSAALDLAYVAAGRLDGYFEMGLKPWDMAAGVLLIQEAGGGCRDFAGASGWMHSGEIVAATPKLLDPLMERLRPHRPTVRAAED